MTSNETQGGGRQTTGTAERRSDILRPPVVGPSRRAGFTLLELLVVLVIIGIVITMATLAVGNGNDELLKTEAQRVATLVDLAGNEATLQGRELGLQFTRTGYRFLFLQPQQNISKPPVWRPIADDRELRQRQFPNGVVAQLQLEDVAQALPAKMPETGTAPQVVLFASGERTPFSLRLGSSDSNDDNDGYQVDAAPLGPPTVQRFGAGT